MARLYFRFPFMILRSTIQYSIYFRYLTVTPEVFFDNASLHNIKLRLSELFSWSSDVFKWIHYKRCVAGIIFFRSHFPLRDWIVYYDRLHIWSIASAFDHVILALYYFLVLESYNMWLNFGFTTFLLNRWLNKLLL